MSDTEPKDWKGLAENLLIVALVAFGGTATVACCVRLFRWIVTP